MTVGPVDDHPLEPAAAAGIPLDDLQRLRGFFCQQQIMICFNGPTNQALIAEIGKALREHIAVAQAEQSLAMDVFSVYVEMSQNIRNYAARQGYDDFAASATIVIAALPDHHYCLSSVNQVEAADAEVLLARIQQLAQLRKQELKALYRQQLRQAPPDPSAAQAGAGLGLLEMARRSSRPMQASIQAAEGGRCCFGLTVTV